MRRYSQSTLLQPGRALVVWLIVIAAAAIAVAVAPHLKLAGASDPLVHDLPTVGGCALAVLVVVMWAALRSWQGVLGTLLVVLAALGVTYGAMSVLGVAASGPIAVAGIFVALFAMVFCTLVGLAHRERVNLERHRTRPIPADKVYLLSESLRDVRLGNAWSAFVMIVALFALFVAAPGAVGRMAGFLALAVLVASVASRTLLPALLAMFPIDPPDDTKDVLHALVTGVTRQVVQRRAVFAALAVLAVAGGIAAVVHLDHTPGGGHLSPPACFAIAAGALGLALWFEFFSLRWALAALVAALPPALVGYVVLAAPHHGLGPLAALAVATALGLVVTQTVHLFEDGNWRQRLERDSKVTTEAAMTARGKALVLTCVVIGLGSAPLLASHADAMVRTAIAMLAVAGTALACTLFTTPALLAMVSRKVRVEPRADDSEWVNGFQKVTAKQHHTSFADFSDDDIRHMFIGDFLALVGKRVMRHGGANGTRRLLAELDLPPNARVLEVGTGVGQTAFDLVKRDPTVRVTSTDLSAFMIESTRRRVAEELPPDQASRIDFALAEDPNRMPFADGTFDAVIVEAVAMYNEVPVFFPELFRVLKPGGRLAAHDWSWTVQPTEELEKHVTVISCACNVGEIKFYTQADWEVQFKNAGFDIRFGESFPFTFFSWGSMSDDEGTWGLLKMFGRVLSRKAIADRMFRMMFQLLRHEGAFGYTITVAEKPKSAAKSEARPEPAAEPAAPAPQPQA